MADKPDEVTPGQVTRKWKVTGFNVNSKPTIQIDMTWTPDGGGAPKSYAILAETDDTYTKITKDPSGRGLWGYAEGSYSFALAPEITSGTCACTVTIKQFGKANNKLSQPLPMKVEPVVLKMEMQTSDKKPLPTQDGKAGSNPLVFFNVPFNVSWSVKSSGALKSVTLKGLPDGDKQLAAAVDAGAEKSDNFAVTLKDAAEGDIALTIVATKADGTDDSNQPKVTVHAAKSTWRTLFPMRKGTRADKASATLSYTSAAPQFSGDAGSAKSLADGIAAARKAIPQRAFHKGGSAGGNVYIGTEDAEGKAANASRPVATGASAEDTKWKVFTGFFPLEGFPITMTALDVDATLTIGVGFSTASASGTTGAGGGPHRIMDGLFKAADANDGIKYLRPSALAAGFAVENTSDGLQFFVADVSDPSNPFQLTGTDASNFICCSKELLSFIVNIAVGVQNDLTASGSAAVDASSDAGKAQKQAMIDVQFKEACLISIADPLPGIADDALTLVCHARHAGFGFPGWTGDGAASVPDVAQKIWDRVKKQQGDTSSGSSGDANHGPTACLNICRAICQGIKAANSVITSNDAAQVDRSSTPAKWK
jgi:hypothetical protein